MRTTRLSTRVAVLLEKETPQYQPEADNTNKDEKQKDDNNSNRTVRTTWSKTPTTPATTMTTTVSATSEGRIRGRANAKAPTRRTQEDEWWEAEGRQQQQRQQQHRQRQHPPDKCVFWKVCELDVGLWFEIHIEIIRMPLFASVRRSVL